MVRVVVMGVSGCGKTTVGVRLAEALGSRINTAIWQAFILPSYLSFSKDLTLLISGAEFYDGDDFHPEANIAKMAAGQSLGDSDRWGTLTEGGSFCLKQKKVQTHLEEKKGRHAI